VLYQMLKLICRCILALLVKEQRFSSPAAHPASVKVLKHSSFGKANGAEEPWTFPCVAILAKVRMVPPPPQPTSRIASFFPIEMWPSPQLVISEWLMFTPPGHSPAEPAAGFRHFLST